MKFFKTYIVQIVFSIIFIAIMLTFFTRKTAVVIDDSLQDYNTNWTLTIGDETRTYEKLPSDFDNKEITEVVYEKSLPDRLKCGDSILFYTSHQSVEVYIGSNLVYQFLPKEFSNTKTPGNGWHLIEVGSDYAGMNLKVITRPSYKSVADHAIEFFYGDNSALIGFVVKSNMATVFLSIVLLTIGIISFVGSIIFKKKLEEAEYVIWLGIFSIILSIWSIADLDLVSLFLGHNVINSHLTYLSLKLVYIPVVTYATKVYNSKEDKLINILTYISIGDFFVTSLLQLFGILDFKETVIFYHILLFVTIIYFFCKSAKELIKGREQQDHAIQLHLISIMMLVLFIGVDLASYYIEDMKSNGLFTKLGIVCYIFILLYLAINKSIILIQSSEKLDRLTQIASRDAITQLHNRTAFQEDLNSISEEEYKDYGIIVFDLNDLKEFNDLYGHSAGDYYIIICSEVIQDIFGKYGSVYRIGGDEFCAIIKDISLETYSSLKERMDDRIESLNGVYFSNHMSIAAGFAVYDLKNDRSLNDTFQRADKNMYDDKTMKKGVPG